MSFRIMAPLRHASQRIEVHPTHLKGHARIKQNVWGNWNGYVGQRKVYEIGASSFDANLWLEEQRKINP